MQFREVTLDGKCREGRIRRLRSNTRTSHGETELYLACLGRAFMDKSHENYGKSWGPVHGQVPSVSNGADRGVRKARPDSRMQKGSEK